MIRSRTFTATLVAAAIAFSGCSFEFSVGNNKKDFVDADRAEREIREGIESQTPVQISEVVCPEDIEVGEDNDFECTATDVDGEPRQVAVTQNADGTISWDVINP